MTVGGGGGGVLQRTSKMEGFSKPEPKGCGSGEVFGLLGED